MEERVNKVAVANVIMTTADKEYQWSAPKGCVWFTLHVRDNTEVRLAMTSGHVASSEPPYFTLKSNSAWNTDRLKIVVSTGMLVFFACASAGKVIEVLIGIYDPDLDAG